MTAISAPSKSTSSVGAVDGGIGHGHSHGTILWPFQDINAALTEYLAEVTDKVIREEVYKETSDAEEVEEPAKIGP